MDDRDFEFQSRSTERLVAALFVIAVVVALSGLSVGAFLFSKDSEQVDDPAARFEEATGLALPTDAKLVAAQDTHGGMHYEGQLQIAFDIDEATIRSWLGSAPPFGEKRWRSGDVPQKVPSFDDEEKRRTGQWFDEARLAQADLAWSGRERGGSSLNIAWQHGDFVAVDVADGRVYFCRWDW